MSRLSGYSAAFTDLLARDRQDLDALLQQRSSTGRDSAARRQRSVETAEPLRADAKTAAELDRRFPGGWSFELRRCNREANEITVVVQLTLTETGLQVVQTGQASLVDQDQSGSGGRRSGTAGGVAFSAGFNRVASDTSAASELEAQAIQDAFAAAARACVDWV